MDRPISADDLSDQRANHLPSWSSRLQRKDGSCLCVAGSTVLSEPFSFDVIFDGVGDKEIPGGYRLAKQADSPASLSVKQNFKKVQRPKEVKAQAHHKEWHPTYQIKRRRGKEPEVSSSS